VSPLRLSKLHATGNDFLVVAGTCRPDQDAVIAVCDRHLGIGADGLILLGPPDSGGHHSMALWNADGAPAEMSGNGIRCLAWVAQRNGSADGRRLLVAAAAGTREVALELDERGDVAFATVDMGAVTFEPAAIPLDAPSAFDLEATFHGVTYHGDAAGMGNPHLVLAVDDPASARVTQHGPRLERDTRFPQRTNVEFVAVTGVDELTLRVWERGVGETLSCGTGACAAAAVAHRRGRVGERVTVHVPGGDLTVEIDATVHLRGQVQHVFDVDVDPRRFGWEPS